MSSPQLMESRRRPALTVRVITSHVWAPGDAPSERAPQDLPDGVAPCNVSLYRGAVPTATGLPPASPKGGE